MSCIGYKSDEERESERGKGALTIVAKGQG